MDIFERVKNQKGNIGQYAKQAHGYFSFPKLEGEIGPRMKFGGKEMLNWSLNNYIGLANDPEVRKADAEAAAKYGMAYPMGARMMSGQTSRHEYLVSTISRLRKGTQSGRIFIEFRVSGYGLYYRRYDLPS